MTSSISLAGTFGFRSISALITTAPRSSGRTSFNAPLYLPIGVRTASTMTTSLISEPTLSQLYNHRRLYRSSCRGGPLSHIVPVEAQGGISLQAFRASILSYSAVYLVRPDRQVRTAP